MNTPALFTDPPLEIPRADELRALGGFASPVAVGAARHAAASLLHALNSRFGDVGARFEDDVFRQCERLADVARAPSLTARLVQKLPRGGGYAPGAERFHIDLDPAAPERDGHRLVRVYYGRATQWVAPESLPEELRRAREAAPADVLFVRYREAMERLHRAPPAPLETPSGTTILYRGGLRAGLVHRAPPCFEARLILVVSAWNGLP